MTTCWIRLESDRPARLFAPSHCPPPSMEGFDKLFDPPLSLRRFTCHAAGGVSSDQARFDSHGVHTEDVYLFRFANESGMGSVTIACGGVGLEACQAAHVVALAVAALRSMNLKSASEILDCLAFRYWTASKHLPLLLDALASPELSRLIVRTSSVSGNVARFLSPTPAAPREPNLTAMLLLQDDPPLAVERVKPSIFHFATDLDAVPLHPLVCGFFETDTVAGFLNDVSGNRSPLVCGALGEGDDRLWCICPIAYTDSKIDTDSNASAGPSTTGRWKKECQQVVQGDLRRCTRVLRGLSFVAAKLLSQAAAPGTPWADPRNCVSAVCGSPSYHAPSGLSCFAIYSLGGLVLGNRAYFSSTTHWEKMIISTAAVDLLIPKRRMLDLTIDPLAAQAVRVVELTLKLSNASKMSSSVAPATAVLVGVGSSVTMVFLFIDTQQQGISGAVFARKARELFHLGQATSSPALSKYLKGENDSDQRTAGLTTLPPVLSGLRSQRGTTGDYINIVSSEPNDALAARQLDELPSSDDDVEDSEASCNVSCATTSSARSTKVTSLARRSQKQLEWVMGEEPHAALFYYSARWRRLDNNHLQSLRRHGVELMNAFVLSGRRDAFGGDEDPHRLLSRPPFHAFSCAWWRHWIASPLPPVTKAARSGLNMLRPNGSRAWTADAMLAACTGATAQPLRAVSPADPSLPVMTDFITVEADRAAFFDGSESQDASSRDSMTIMHHVESNVIAGEVSSSLVSTAVLTWGSSLDDASENLLWQRGFDVQSRRSPLASLGPAGEVAWRNMKQLHRHMSMTAIAAATLQRRLLSD